VLPEDLERVRQAGVAAFGSSFLERSQAPHGGSAAEAEAQPLVQPKATRASSAPTGQSPRTARKPRAKSRSTTSPQSGGAEARFQVPEEVLARYLALDFYKQALLRAIHYGPNFRSLEHLAEVACQDVLYLPGHLRKLEEAGIISQTSPMQYELDPAFVAIVERESGNSVSVRVVAPGASSGLYQSVFKSDRERRVFQVARELFPNYLTYPNMALRTVFEPDVLKEHLSKEAFSFLWKGSVDIMVVSAGTDLPIGGIEVDSIYHDTAKQQRRDGFKDQIFQVCGLPLFRLRVTGNPSPEEVRRQLAEQISKYYGSPDAVHEAFRRLLHTGA
jgi:hypothetical protein